jgi:peptidoglycan hydrolase-like protein with peptidoglycan-binding domain
MPATVHASSREGDKGQEVLKIEYILKSYGYAVKVDGVFDRRTTKAVMHWQRANGLVVDGIVGPITMATLTPAVRLNPPKPAPAPAMSVEEIIRDVWPDNLEDEAIRIATRESHLIPTVRNACCYGLFQIYYYAHQKWLTDYGVNQPSDLFDARTNAQVAYALYQQVGWQPWAL